MHALQVNEHIRDEHAGATSVVEEMEMKDLQTQQESVEELVIVDEDSISQVVQLKPEAISLEGQQVKQQLSVRYWGELRPDSPTYARLSDLLYTAEPCT